uniref:Exocyst subunit Exo70 family protein n=1 Tax=Oryza glumipatula TaxID=40148 RepID=A0A0D9ZYA0_9ORYZ
MQLRICINDVSDILVPLYNEVFLLADYSKEIIESIVKEIDDVFSTTMDNLGRAILMMTTDALSPPSGPFPENAEIHKATLLAVNYAILFWGYHSVLEAILLDNGDLFGNCSCYSEKLVVERLIVQIITNLQDELEKKSKLFSDHSLRYLFLLNNSYVVQYQFLVPSDYSPPSEIKFHYEQYQKEYMRASWEPVLSCLHDKMPPCFPKLSSHSELSRFGLEFEKTCSHQKLWKVPLPNLRQSLRETIIDKIITGYKKYMEDHPEQEKCGRDPLDMEGMVNDLFEG